VWYFQVYDDKVHVIEYNEFTGRSTNDLCYILRGDFDPLLEYLDEAIVYKLRKKYSHHANYNYKEHFAPHDIRNRSQATAISPLVEARKRGINFTVLPKQGVMEGINNVRRLFPHIHFDAEKCMDGLSAIRNYRKKYDSKNNVFLDTPLHDWASDGADAFRYAAAAVTIFIDKKFVEHANKAKKNQNAQHLPARKQTIVEFVQEVSPEVFDSNNNYTGGNNNEAAYALH
jgi:hypothetical protein